MQNPFDSNNEAGSYFNLKKKIFERVQASGINQQVIESIRNAYEDAIKAENIALTVPEKKRLLFQISRLVLDDLSKTLDNTI